ncbi:MAG: ABC transporter ATP-binding protein [Granulosicoccus sp.]
MSLLTLSGVQAHYGPVQALFDVSLELPEGKVLALMGRNGMGKSSTIKSICRMLPVSAGSIRFASHDLLRLPSYKAARLGIGLVPEGRRCFASLTVRENLIVAARAGDWNLQSVGELFPRLAERQGQLASQLSGGEQQMLAIARALMTNPRLLILDEATEGLAPMVRKEIWQSVATLKKRSALSIIVVDKSLRELSAVADYAVFLERGSVAWSGPMQSLSDAVAEKYLGV